MNRFALIKRELIAIIALGILFPLGVFAQTNGISCSPEGYSIFTINGIFTKEEEAGDNKRALEDRLPKTFNNEPITIDFLHNPPHLAGAGDILKSIYQGLFDSETVEDYDLVEMLQDASEKVATQKLFLVAHSQGNFYANSFYDTVADKAGGAPAESIGVYSVATPSSRVAGEGKWLTSDTDKVIVGIVSRIHFRKILPPNVHIELREDDSSSGHGFSDIYLKYQGGKIISDIKSSLDRLKTNNIQDAQKPCLEPPKLSIAHKIKGATFAVADPVANGVSKAVLAVTQTAVSISTNVVKTGVEKVVEVAQTIKKTFSELFKKDEFQLAQVVDLSQETQSDQSGQGQSQPSNFKQCSFNTSQSASHSKVIINEVAWMGGVNSANDEWVELKNISGSPLDISGYQLLDKDEQIKIIFPKDTKIPVGGFLLLERGSDEAVPSVKADLIYSGALSNTDEGLRLFDGGCSLIDEVLANSKWPAGDNAAKKTMERNSSDLTWHTSAVIGGTPKKENSQPVIAKKQETAINPSEETEEEDEEIILQQKEQTKQPEQTQQATSSPPQTASFKQCSFSTNQSPLRQKIIINEVAWMGMPPKTGETNTQAANNEWIELKNFSGGAVDLNGWQLIDKGEQIKITFGSKDKIQVNGFYLLERTDDNSVPNITANKIYTGVLSNTNEGLRLFDNNCNLIDEVLANPDWPAGDNTQKRSMERSPDFSWHNYNGVAQNNILGTPKAENSQPTVVYSGGGGGGTPSNQSSNNPSPQSYSVIINEIMYDLQGADEGREWVEIFNSGNAATDLTNWKFYENQTNHGLTVAQGSATLPVGGYAVIVSDSGKFLTDNPGYSGTILKSSFSLSNTGEAIALKNGDSIVDQVNYQSSWGANGNGKSLQLINNEWREALPTPGQTNQLSSNNQSPSAFFVYTPQNPNVGDLITFNAASSSDPDPDGQIVSYQWDFGDNSTSTISTATTTHSYSQAGNYSVNLIVFDNQNASSTATSTIISVNASGADHMVISEILFDAQGSDEGKEFIEIYNPTNSNIDIENWSLRILKNNATSTDLLVKFGFKDEDIALIKSKGFLLAGFNNYTSTSTPADTVRSTALPNSTSTIYLIDSNNVEIDQIIYSNILQNVGISEGQSLERKAFDNNQCVSSQNDGEFLGNGCDTDSDSDFEIRNTPSPQNSQSFSEPRNAPTTPQGFSVQYSSSTMELIFNWDASQDYSGATSTLTYKITDISSASSTLATINTTSTTAKISISEFGRSYNFSIIAIDKEGYESEKSEASTNISQNLTIIIAQQLDKASFERGTGNGQLYQLLGSGLTAEPKEVTFHAKFLTSGYWKQTNYINATFWQSDKSDYSNLIKVSSNTCTRDDPGATYYDQNNIYGSDCPNLNFEFNVEKNYTIPIQQSFVFNPAKYYKLTLFVYQSESYFYGSSDESSYLYGKSTRDSGGGAEIDSSSTKDLYFIIRAKLAFEIPLQTSQLTPQNFALSYSSSTYEINFSWEKPRYLENSTSSLIYKIVDISVASSTLPNTETVATSTKISINEVGRNYKFSIQAFDENGIASLTDEKEIKIPHSLAEKFIIASQTDKTIFEQGRINGDFYQTLGAGLSGKLGAVTFKANTNPYYLSVNIFQSDNPDYSNPVQFYEVARCNFIQSYGEPYCSNQLIEPDTYIVPVSGNFVFDPLKYYKLSFITYQNAPYFYGSADESSYPNGQTTKLDGGGWEIQTSTIRDLYFILTSRTPLR